MVDRFSEMIGKFEEFKEWEVREHHDIKHDLVLIKNKIDNLFEFKWKIVGMALLVSVVAGSVTTIIFQIK
jgi:hypothetical protein